MAMLGSIMDIFRPTPSATSTVVTPPAPIVDPSKTNPTIPSSKSNTSDGSVLAIPKAGEGDKSPLEKYDDLWQPADPKTVKAPKTAADLAIPITADPAKLLEAARGVDFLKSVNHENIEKALKGDNTALLAVVNESVQAGLAHSAANTSKLITAALTKQAKVFQDEVMPEILRRHDISRGNAADNPVLQSDAVKPLLSLVEGHLATKNPSASASEIATNAREYMNDIAGEILKANGMTVTPKPKDGDGSKTGAVVKRSETNWEDWFGAGANG